MYRPETGARTEPYRVCVPRQNESMKAFEQQNRKFRGHDFYQGLDNLPRLYETEDIPTGDKLIGAHFFISAANWWIIEFDPETGRAFGYANIMGGGVYGEWVYVHIPELEALTTKTLGVVERDLYWKTKPFREAIPHAVTEPVGNAD